MTLFSLFILSGNAYAAVGDGGSGGASGSGAEAHWTNRGWGWAIYQTSGPGPQEPNFRNGYPWTSAKAQCESENAATVTMHIIYDGYGKGMVYDYKSVQDGPPMYSAHFAAGSLVDGGRATAINTPDAQARFNALPAGERAGFTFGNNVGWFCTDRGPTSTVNASCAITSYPSSVSVGQSFTASFSISNTGNTVWSVDPSVPDRFKLGSASPQDNNTWGATRKEIAGVASGFGYVVYNGTTTTTWPNPATFTAPSTPGTYTFAWQVLREGVSWYGSTCSVPITVNGPPAADCNPPWNNPVRDIGLPNQGAPGGDSHNQVSYTNVTEVQSVRDQWGQYISTYTGGGNNSVTVDYSPWFNSYKYDYHTPIVRYRVQYKIDHYDHHIHTFTYSCDPPGPATSGTCTGSYHEDHYTNTTYHWTGYFDQNGETALCRYRNFDWENPLPQDNNVQWNDFDEEEPSTVSFGSRVDTRFTLIYGTGANPPLRQSFRLNYNATAAYWIERNNVPMAFSSTRVSTSGGSSCTNQFSGSDTVNGTQSPSTVTEYYRDCFRATIGPLQAGDRACFSLTFPYRRGQINPEGNVIGGTTAGGTYSFTECSIRLVDKPYVRAFGGDVYAGIGTPGVCTPGPGTINTFNRGSKTPNANGAVPAYGNSQWGGSGTQLAAYAVSTINEFVSAQTRTANPRPAKGLTFANTPAATYGGTWNVNNMPCQYDFFAEREGSDPGSGIGISPLNGAYSRTGDMVINGGNINPNTKLAIYVQGNISINGDIMHVPGSYAGPKAEERIPSVRIIASGNIYIHPSVNRIDAVLIAQQNGGSGGIVYTCSDGGFGLPSTAQYNGTSSASTSCRRTLTVYGAILAHNIRFLRSQGSIRNANVNQGPVTTHNAERIIFTPDLWFVNPAVTTKDREPYEAFTSLPPIL